MKKKAFRNGALSMKKSAFARPSGWLALCLSGLLALSACQAAEPPSTADSSGLRTEDGTRETLSLPMETTTVSSADGPAAAFSSTLPSQNVTAATAAPTTKKRHVATSTTRPTGERVTEGTAPVTAPPTQVPADEPLSRALSPLDTADYYGARQLSGNARLLTAYRRLAAAVSERREGAVYLADLKLSLDEMQRAYAYVRADFPQVFWLDASYRYHYTDGDKIVDIIPAYTFSAAELPAAKAAVNAAAAKLLEGITGDMSPYERELAIHDRLVEQTAYDESQSQPQIHNLYGVLVNRLAVCDGYSKAFQYLLYQAGVPCLFVTGQSQGEGHAWNLVQLDGAYYHVDITWDDPVYNGIREADKPVFYGYFNVTTAQIREDHTMDAENYPLPDCTAAALNYYHKNGLVQRNFQVDAVAALVKTADREDGIARLWVEGDFDAFADSLRQNWTAISRAAGVYRGARFHYCSRELLIVLQ